MKLRIRARLVLISFALVLPTLLGGYLFVRQAVSGLFDAPSKQLSQILSIIDGMFVFALVAAAGAVFVLSTAAASIALRAARALAQSARKLAEGDVVSLAVRADGDFGELGAALEQLARGYSAALADFRRERDRLRGILVGMQEGVLLLDRERHVGLVNPALREMLLLGPEVEGKSPLEIVRHGELIRLLEDVEESGEPATGEIELGGLKPRQLLIHVVPIPGEEGGLLAVFIDVTHLRRLEALRKDFVANASHELRTPVAAIYSAAETLELAVGQDPDAAREFVDIIVRNATRLKNLVDDLLDLSRIESQDFQVHAETIEADDAVLAVVGLFAERASKKGIALTADCDPEALLFADRRGLEHVLTNLVDNAVKYCGPGSTVTVTALKAGERKTEIVVGDTGPGIERQHLPRIFERFYRVDPGRSRRLGGTGLGLSIVKHLVEAMRGNIRVESEPGKGTRFILTLPGSAPEVPRSLPPPAAAASPGS